MGTVDMNCSQDHNLVIRPTQVNSGELSGVLTIRGRAGEAKTLKSQQVVNEIKRGDTVALNRGEEVEGTREMRCLLFLSPLLRRFEGKGNEVVDGNEGRFAGKVEMGNMEESISPCPLPNMNVRDGEGKVEESERRTEGKEVVMRRWKRGRWRCLLVSVPLCGWGGD